MALKSLNKIVFRVAIFSSTFKCLIDGDLIDVRCASTSNTYDSSYVQNIFYSIKPKIHEEVVFWEEIIDYHSPHRGHTFRNDHRRDNIWDRPQSLFHPLFSDTLYNDAITVMAILEQKNHSPSYSCVFPHLLFYHHIVRNYS